MKKILVSSLFAALSIPMFAAQAGSKPADPPAQNSTTAKKTSKKHMRRHHSKKNKSQAATNPDTTKK